MESERPEKRRKLANDQILESKSAAIEASNGPDFFSSGKLKFTDIRKKVIRYFREDRYEQLKSELFDAGFLEKNKVEKFFLREGDVILSWSLSATSDRPLRFLASEDGIVPREILKAVLKQDNCSALQAFFYREVVLEGTKKHTPESEEIQIKKFKILLDLDHETVKECMQECTADRNFERSAIKKNFAEAERQFVQKISNQPCF